MSQGYLFAFFTIVTFTWCDATCNDSPSVWDRLESMEQQLRQQNDVLAVRLSDLDHLNRRLMWKLSKQEDKLSEQEKTIRQQGSRLSQQEDRLSEQEKIINQQGSKLVHQDQIITKLLANYITPAMPLKSMSFQSEHIQDKDSSVTSQNHDVIARSDDTGALGVVVNKMSAEIQVLKNMDIKQASDIQALITSHASKIQALHASHDSDIQALHVSHASDIQALKTSYASDIQALNTSHASDIQALTSLNKHQDQDIHDARSSSFVRWGSSHCPSNSSLVYSGVVGGSYYTDTGAAVNYLCLTMSPKFAADRSLNYYAALYGGEYDTFDSNMDRKPVCAVCRASFSTTIMIPGTNVCTSGLTPLFSGYLMANPYGHSAGSEYVCVDVAQESSPGTVHNDNGKLFSFTKTRCGSLPCGPYVNDKVVTCVVCGQ